MPRFVILEHDYPELHWDLMLEAGARLRTWRLAEAPRGDAAIPALALADHRVMYLDYEGPVSGGRGTVRRWESGTFRAEGDAEDEMKLMMEGSRRKGEVILRRLSGDLWQFRWATNG
jgi:hypothetical protein